VQTESNETFTADFGNAVDLAGYNIDESTLVVVDSNGDTIPESNYSVDTEPGEITVFSNATNSGVSDGDSLETTYDYQATGSTTTTVVGFIPVMLGVLLMVALSRKIEMGM